MRHEQSGVTLSYSISSWRVRCFSCLSIGLFVYLSIGPFVYRIYQILSICICLLSRAISTDCNIHVSSCFYLFLHWFSPPLFVSMFICLVHYRQPIYVAHPSTFLRAKKTAIPQVAKRASTWAVRRGASPYAFAGVQEGAVQLSGFAPGDLYYVGCRGHQVC